jgi:fibro-slime domain-containing protein
MVASQLGDDRKPVLIDAKGVVTSKDTFDQWFRSVPGVNQVFHYPMTATWSEANQAYAFEAPQFFPIDGQGFGDDPSYHHNFGFCMEVHSQFTYMPGQKYDFTGDDDVWVFINNQLVIDLGSLHSPASGSVNLDTLGLTKGETYPFDFFSCERHVDGSTLKFTCNIELFPCGKTDSDSDGIFDDCDQCPKGDVNVKLSAKKVTGNTVSVTLDLENPPTSNLDFNLNFGDGETTVVNTGMDTTLTHTYKSSGEYKITVSSVAASGCGSSSDEVTVDCKSNQTAPKCSELGITAMLPGQTPTKKK